MSDGVYRRVEVDTASAKELRDVASFERDFMLAARFLDLYLASDVESAADAPNELDALWVVAVIHYGRAFHKDVRRTPIQLSDIYDEEQRDSHQYFFALRNKFLAHSVNGFERTTITVGLTDPTLIPMIVEVRVAHDSVSRLAAQHAQVLRNLCQLQLTALAKRSEELRNRVFAETRLLGMTYLYNLPAVVEGGRFDPGQVDKRRK